MFVTLIKLKGLHFVSLLDTTPAQAAAGRSKPEIHGPAESSLWNVVESGISLTMMAHPAFNRRASRWRFRFWNAWASEIQRVPGRLGLSEYSLQTASVCRPKTRGSSRVALVPMGEGRDDRLTRNYSLILAGGSSPGLKHGEYRRYDEHTPLSNMHLTVLQQLGVRTNTFADSSGVLSELV